MTDKDRHHLVLHNWERYSELRCRKCGDAYLHHHQVETFFRDEDHTFGLCVRVSEGSGGPELRVTDELEGNPSPRRDGIRIWLTCECCPALSYLEIWQHKGQTLMAMREAGLRDEECLNQLPPGVRPKEIWHGPTDGWK